MTSTLSTTQTPETAPAEALLEAALAEVRDWQIGLRGGSRIVITVPMGDGMSMAAALAVAMAKPGPQVFYHPTSSLMLRADLVDYIYPASRATPTAPAAPVDAP